MLTCCCCWLNTTIFSSIVLFYCVRFSLLKQSVRVSFIQMMPPRHGGSCSRGPSMRFENRKIKKERKQKFCIPFFSIGTQKVYPVNKNKARAKCILRTWNRLELTNLHFLLWKTRGKQNEKGEELRKCRDLDSILGGVCVVLLTVLKTFQIPSFSY